MKRLAISGVYTITNIINGKLYVGCSCDIMKRFGDHRSFLRNNSHPNSHIQAAYNKHGKDSLKFEILIECCEEFMYSEENFWVNMLNSCNREFGYNLRSTNPERGSFRHSDESKSKISAAGIGRPSSMKGQKHSDESREKMSKSLMGRIISVDTIEKRLATRKLNAEKRGYYLSEEHKRKIGESNRHPKSEEHIASLILSSPNKRPILMYDRDWNFIKEFNSLSDARREVGCAINLISMALKNTNRSAKGFRFKYKNLE